MAFLLDDILLAPVKGLHFIAEKVRDAAMEELLDEEGVRRELRELYTLLESGEISEEEFEEGEGELIERLEEIEAYKDGRTDVS
ncbi:MAG: gas vesicle protein GvpG [Candidatus Latescibacteria bacterium]|nr:gas vesicle protein GvpG [Candidatus Latescibacterota bacterium]